MMKTRKYIAVIFAAMVMGISGCNDDLFLEEHPDTFYTAEDAFKTVDQVKACASRRRSACKRSCAALRA